MATIQEFKTIRASVSPEVQTELYGLLVQNLYTAVQRMIDIGNENGVSFTAEEVRSYLQEMDEDDEFDDVELDEATLAAVSGGSRGQTSCCKEEAHDEPWGRCPGMRPMRKWLFGLDLSGYG